MKAIVGKCVLLLFLCSATHAELVLRVTTMDDVPLTQAAIGEPFLIQVSELGSSGSIKQPDLIGLDGLVQQGTSFAMHTINNSSTVVYKYKVRADKTGAYTVGPASIAHANTLQESNSIELTVGKETILDKKRYAKSNVFVKLDINKNNVVVGEKVICTLTLYSSDTLQTRVQEIQEPTELKEYCTVMGNQEDIEQGTEQVNGKNYMYGRWSWELYPKQAGSITLPAFSVDYTVLNSGYTLFNFMNWQENKRAYSNAVELTIMPLPPYHKPVQAIGMFTSYTAVLEPSVAQEGAAMELHLTVEGDGNWGVIQIPEFSQMDDTLRSYYSTSSVKPSTLGEGRLQKTFEYIVQGLQAGQVTIEPQMFTYYDTNTQQYKTLHTAQLHATITPNPNPIVPFNEPEEPVQPMPDIRGLRTVNLGTQQPRVIPLWLFALLGLLPLLYLMYLKGSAFYYWYTKRYEPVRKKQNAFKQAKKALKTAQTNREYESIYDIFMQLFADRAGVRPSHMDSERVDRLLSVLTLENRVQWDLFFERLITLRFRKNEHDTYEIFERACIWIETFKQERIGDEVVTTTAPASFS